MQYKNWSGKNNNYYTFLYHGVELKYHNGQIPPKLKF